jgi:tetratricopeptide (TPR) repeat protein
MPGFFYCAMAKTMLHTQPMKKTQEHPHLQAHKREDQVLQLIKQAKMKQAVAACQQLNSRFPQFTSGWYTASQLATKLGNPTMALRAIEKALRLEPSEKRWLLQQAFCLMALGQTAPAREIALSLDKHPLNCGYQCASMGLLLSRLGLHSSALRHYQQAIRLEPEIGEHYYNVATLHRFMGNFSAAETALDSALEKNPEDFDAYKLRADLRKQTPHSNHIASLELALEKYAGRPRAIVQLHYALAKELEDIEQWQQSFGHLQRGAASRRKLMRYDVQGDLDTMAEIGKVYGASLFQGQICGDDSSEAIFILGMPRTGSTLLERILGSHSDVFCAGELNNFALQMMKSVQDLSKHSDEHSPLTKTQRVERSAAIDFSELGKRYIASTRPATGLQSRFIDKMPANFLYAGLIHLALPQAKIIHVKRHPLDCCYAIYKNLFADAYPFSYQIEELAAYYGAYEQLMAHWHCVMPGVIYDIYYEDLVGDVEGQSRKLLEHCNLQWQEQCLTFYNNTSVSTTASASQIRQPVYNSSVGKWRHFAAELSPLAGMLREAGVDFELD